MALNVIYSVELLEFSVLLNALLVELFKRTVALSILSTKGSCSSVIDWDLCDQFTDTTWRTVVALVCITNLLMAPNNCNSSSKVFVTNLLTSVENTTPVVNVYQWFTDTSLSTIYTSVIIVGTCVTNLLASFISTKREYHLVVGIQPSGIVVIYFDFSYSALLRYIHTYWNNIMA